MGYGTALAMILTIIGVIMVFIMMKAGATLRLLRVGALDRDDGTRIQHSAPQRTEDSTRKGPPSASVSLVYLRYCTRCSCTALLILASLFVLLPVGWMLTAALKPDTAPVFTFPPEWFPTRYWHWQTFQGSPLQSRQFIRYTANSAFLVVMNVIGVVTLLAL